MADRFYTNCPLQPGPVLLQGAEAHHLAAVRRLRPGDLVCLFNGDGREYPARVVAVERRSVSLEILDAEAPDRELPFPLVVAAPVPKGDRAQFLIEKLTELGVTAFVPLRTRRSVIHPGEGRQEKWERHVIEASKQCGRNVLLRVEPPADWPTFCRRGDLPALKILAHPAVLARRASEGPSREPAASSGPGLPAPVSPSGVVMAVGPEGGFTDEEVSDARAAGWQVADLGPRILRVETAAIFLAAWAVLAAPPFTGVAKRGLSP